jgi:hypothetical protein
VRLVNSKPRRVRQDSCSNGIGAAAVLGGTAAVLGGTAAVLGGTAAVLGGTAAVLGETAAVLGGTAAVLGRREVVRAGRVWQAKKKIETKRALVRYTLGRERCLDGRGHEPSIQVNSGMQQKDTPSVAERRASQNRVYRRAFAVAFLLHLLLLVSWQVIPIPRSPLSAAGPRAGDFLAAGGGMQSLNLQVNSRPIVRPRVPVISLEMTEEPIVFDAEPQLDLSASVGEAPGLGDGPPGIEGGRGRGDGGTAAQGFFQMIPPSPRGLIMPPSHESLKGKQVEVWVFVDVTGKVVADSTRLNPPTSNGGFNRLLIKEAAEWVFNPARRNDQAIAAWVSYTISM